jgi:four helix bundle protein
MIKAAIDLEVFKLSYQLAMDIFVMTRSFPKEEKYSLTDQIVHSSRSVSANIAEGCGRRIYEN